MLPDIYVYAPDLTVADGTITPAKLASSIYGLVGEIKALGAVSAGSSVRLASADHVHPTTGVALLGSANAFTVGGHTIATGADSTSGISISRNSATQSAALFNLFMSNGSTVLSQFGAQGNLAIRNDNGAAGTVPLSVTANATQTTNLFQILSSASVSLFTVSSAGALTVSPSAGTAATINAASGAIGLQVIPTTANSIVVRDSANSVNTWLVDRYGNTSIGYTSALNRSAGTLDVTANSTAQPVAVFTGHGANGASTFTNDMARYRSWDGTTATVLGGRNAVGQVWSGSTAPVTVTTGGATSGASSGTTATMTTTTAHGLAVGDLVTIAGVAPSGYNGTYLVQSPVTSTTYTVTTSGSNLGASSVSGTTAVPAQASFTARSAGTVGLVVKAAASQTANIANFQTSSGTVLSIDNTGALNSSANISTGANLRVGSQNIGISGSGVMALANAGTVPSANATGGGYLYSEGGALKWRGSSGTVTTIANA